MNNVKLKEKVEEATQQIKAMQNLVMDYINDNEIDNSVALSFLISMLGIGIAGEAGNDVEGQDMTIGFISDALKISLAENGYRPVTNDMTNAIPPWEKN